jgi:hypothetical protein
MQRWGYFFSKYLVKKVLINSAILTLGAVVTDLYYFKKMPFDTSFFFVSGYKIYFFNMIVWYLSAIAVIYLRRLLKAKKKYQRAQPVCS